MIKFTDEQIKSMRDGYPPSEYDFEESIISLSYEVAELRECLKEAVGFHCGKCINKSGPCNKDCLFDRWRKALEGAKDEGKGK